MVVYIMVRIVVRENLVCCPTGQKILNIIVAVSFSCTQEKKGEEFSALARNGDPEALMIFKDFGFHMGNAIQTVLYTYDPDLIVLGGSISKDFDLFCESMWESIYTFAYKSIIKSIRIQPSETEHSAVLGAASLYLDHLKRHPKTPHYQKL